jgi:hypothetical protein
MLGTIIIDELLSCHTTVYTILRWRFEKLDYFFFFYADVIISGVHLNLVRVDCDGERTTRQSVE